MPLYPYWLKLRPMGVILDRNTEFRSYCGRNYAELRTLGLEISWKTLIIIVGDNKTLSTQEFTDDKPIF